MSNETTNSNDTNNTNATNIEIEKRNNELKYKIELIVNECFKKCAENKYNDLNYVFDKRTTPMHQLKQKLKTFNSLDNYSQTFLSIHTRAKITLREFQSGRFDFNACELLRLVLTLPDELRERKMKSIGIAEKVIDELKTNENVITENKNAAQIESDETANKKLPSLVKKKTKIAKVGTTGKKHYRKKINETITMNHMKTIEIEDLKLE